MVSKRKLSNDETRQDLNEWEDEDVPYRTERYDQDDGGGDESQEIFPCPSHCIHLPARSIKTWKNWCDVN